VRHRRVVLGCLAPFLCLALAALAYRTYRAADPVYSVADVQAGLRQQPRNWAGRVLLLRGVIAMQVLWVGCGRPACPGASLAILLPAHQPAWSGTQQLWASMDISRLLMRPHPTVGNAGSHQALGIGRAIGQGLVLVVRPGFLRPPRTPPVRSPMGRTTSLSSARSYPAGCPPRRTIVSSCAYALHPGIAARYLGCAPMAGSSEHGSCDNH